MGYYFFAKHMPYCAKKLGPDKWVFLNRDYKPLGYLGKEWVDYEDYAVKVRLTSKDVAKLSIYPHRGMERDWTGSEGFLFYDGSTSPGKSGKNKAEYLQKIEFLMNKNISLFR